MIPLANLPRNTYLTNGTTIKYTNTSHFSKSTSNAHRASLPDISKLSPSSKILNAISSLFKSKRLLKIHPSPKSTSLHKKPSKSPKFNDSLSYIKATSLENLHVNGSCLSIENIELKAYKSSQSRLIFKLPSKQNHPKISRSEPAKLQKILKPVVSVKKISSHRQPQTIPIKSVKFSDFPYESLSAWN